MNKIDINAVRRNSLNKRLETLVQEFDAAYSQLNGTLNAVDEVKIKGQIAAIEHEMEETDARLKELDQADARHSPAPHHRQWEETLPELDFRRAWLDFCAIFEEHIDREEGGAALFLLPDYNRMRGDLLLRRIHTWLQQKVGYTKVRRAQIELLDHNGLTSQQLLQRLGSVFGCPPPIGGAPALTLAAYVDQIIEKICAALERDGVLLIELTVVPIEFYIDESFLRWFLDHFWSRLTQRLAAVVRETHRPSLKCIIAIAAHQPLPPAYPLAERYCQAAYFNRARCHHIVPLPLTLWSQEDIRTWLRRQPQFGDHWDEQTLSEKAYSLFARGDNGTPISVFYYLQEMFTAAMVSP